MNKKVYIIGIGGIGVSAVARYYNENGYDILGSDKADSELIQVLISEGMSVIIGEDDTKINKSINLIIYTEAISDTQIEFIKAKKLGIRCLSYPEALAKIVNNKKLIAISGTHGKSTTTSLTSLVLKNSNEKFGAIIGTILKEFNNKNYFYRGDNNDSEDFFAIEACEYKRSFLKYKATLGVIVNIEIDHLDYYKDLDDYISAYKDFLDNIKPGGFAILNGDDANCNKLVGLRKDISYIEIFEEYFTYNETVFKYPKINLSVPGEHILFDAKIAYVVGYMLGIKNENIVSSLEAYNGVWRRMEVIGKTINANTLMSDYGHHPTEIKLTTKAIKEKYPDKELFVIFQPHQYNRTIELLEDFKECFNYCDTIIIPNIYESRDSLEDKKNMNSKILINNINHNNKLDGKGLEKTLELIQSYDKKNSNNIILLLGAGDIDNLRYKIDYN